MAETTQSIQAPTHHKRHKRHHKQKNINRTHKKETYKNREDKNQLAIKKREDTHQKQHANTTRRAHN